MNGLRNRRSRMTFSNDSTLRRPSHQLANYVVNQSMSRDNLLHGIIMLATFHARKQLLGTCYNRQIRTATVRDVSTFLEKLTRTTRSYRPPIRWLHVSNPQQPLLNIKWQHPRFRQGPHFRYK